VWYIMLVGLGFGIWVLDLVGELLLLIIGVICLALWVDMVVEL